MTILNPLVAFNHPRANNNAKLASAFHLRGIQGTVVDYLLNGRQCRK